MTIDALRTPDSRFADLPGFGFAPHYADDLPGYEGLRVHYLDEGTGARTFLCLHGQPTWSYLFRRMIPVFTGAGARVVAPDWLGFGRSDKPTDEAVYGFAFHRDMVLALIERLDLARITLVVQDWGGLLGLTLPMQMPERIERLLIMNTALPVGGFPGKGFIAWRQYCRDNPDFDVARFMQRTTPHLSAAEAAAYAAPFPDARYRAGARRFPEMVMTEPGMEGVDLSRRARAYLKDDWQGESFMAVGMADPVLGAPAMADLRATIRGCPEPYMLKEGGHFLQEWGESVARAALEAWGDQG